MADNETKEFNVEWGGKVMITLSNVELMREWTGNGVSENTILGLNSMSDLSHLSATISLLDVTEPESCRELGTKLKELVNLYSVDRVEKNEIPAIELMLRERYYGQGLPLIERLGAHVNRGFNILKNAKNSIEDLENITIFDILKEVPSLEKIFQKSIGITPIQTSIDNFI